MRNQQQRNRHELKKARETKAMTIGMLSVAILLVVAYCAMSRLMGSHGTEASPTVQHQWTEQELKAFWVREAQTLVQEDLMNGRLPFPEVNDRFRTLNERIIARTGKSFQVSLNTEYHWADKRVEGSSGIDTNGVEGIGLYVPAILDTFEILRKAGSPQWHGAFQTHLITIIMHEMEHTEAKDKTPGHIDTKEESRAWAETCRHTIAPLFETHKQTLSESEYGFYRAWKLANGNPSSIYWLNAVRKRYGVIEGKTPPK